MKVFIVDDSNIDAHIMEDMLTTKNVKVRSVFNTDNLKQKVLDYNPDLIILDLVLPNDKGEDVLKRFSSDPELKDYLIMVISSKDKEEFFNGEVRNLAIDFISKPITKHSFISKSLKYAMIGKLIKSVKNIKEVS